MEEKKFMCAKCGKVEVSYEGAYCDKCKGTFKMIRKIIFRGYNLKNKKWLYGYYFLNRGKSYIVEDETANPFCEPEDFEVDPKSVGQYVGIFYDVDVYDGDIVEYETLPDLLSKPIECRGVVKYSDYDGMYFICAEDGKVPVSCQYYTLTLNVMKYKVIGNSYENLETNSPE